MCRHEFLNVTDEAIPQVLRMCRHYGNLDGWAEVDAVMHPDKIGAALREMGTQAARVDDRGVWVEGCWLVADEAMSVLDIYAREHQSA